MMYPYYLIADGERIATKYHDLYVANPVAEAVLLIQRGFWTPTCDGPCVVDPATGAALPDFVDDLYTRGLVMLGHRARPARRWASSCFSRLEKTVPERL